MAVEDAAEDVLAECVAERRHGLEHPDVEGIESGSANLGMLSPMWCETGICASSMDVPHPVHRRARVIDCVVLQVLAGRKWHQERLDAECLQFAERPPVSSASHN